MDVTSESNQLVNNQTPHQTVSEGPYRIRTQCRPANHSIQTEIVTPPSAFPQPSFPNEREPSCPPQDLPPPSYDEAVVQLPTYNLNFK